MILHDMVSKELSNY